MLNENRFVKKSARLRFGFGLLLGILASVSVASAQYPTKPEISKDGTAVLLEDYASLPLASPTHGGLLKELLT